MDSEARKTAAVEFLRMAAGGDAAGAGRRFLAPQGRHHNPHFAAGWDALLTAMDDHHREAPGLRMEVKHVLGDGDYVAVHSHVWQRSGEPGGAVLHLFRFEGDKIAELWDLGQEIPADSPNADGPF